MTVPRRRAAFAMLAIATSATLSITVLPATGARAEERAVLLGRASPERRATFDVFVPPAPDPALDALLAAQVTPGSPQYHHFLTPGEYRARFGTQPARLAEVAAALQAAGLEISERHAHGLRVAGQVSRIERAFSTRLSVGAFQSGRTALVAETALAMPEILARAGAVVPAFSGRIRMRRHSLVGGSVRPDNRSGGAGPYWFTDLRQAYDLPDARLLDGTGVNIGILMSGDYNAPDIARYFAHEKSKMPKLDRFDVFGGAAYTAADSVETHLDIQQSGGMAPGAHITLYNLPDLSDGAILAGLSDIDETNQVDIVNMSFGAPEILYAASYNAGQDYTGLLRALDALFKQGNAQGITFVASSGDAGALDAVPLACLSPVATAGCGYYGVSADHPASSPYVTAVGGTNLVTVSDPAKPTDLDSRYVRENAQYDRLDADVYYGTPAQGAIWGSGGGISLFEARPDWQKLAPTGSTRFRTIPDVAGHMGGCIHDTILPCAPDRSADVVAIGGGYRSVHGTSASAPDFAGILALKSQHLGGRLGNVNAEIYQRGHDQRAHLVAPAFRDDIPGDNGYYPATKGYNLVLGNGTVRGRAFIGVPTMAHAGDPQTPSNP